jgi:hypothetical protein
MRRSGLVLVLCTLLVMAALPAAAGQKPIDRVPAGLDYWQTLSFGATAYSFAREPLPAGFFCAGSPAFTGEVLFEGVPLKTEPAGILGTTDTVIERLDDAVFNARGEATSRLRARALDLRATEPVKTACGSFKVTAGLAEDQPVTSITFHRQNKFGGIFNADLHLRVRIDFTNRQGLLAGAGYLPADRRRRALRLRQGRNPVLRQAGGSRRRRGGDAVRRQASDERKAGRPDRQGRGRHLRDRLRVQPQDRPVHDHVLLARPVRYGPLRLRAPLHP